MTYIKKLHTTYERHLTNFAQAGEYKWGPDHAPVVAELMIKAIDDGRKVDLNGPAWRATTKELGIKHNHKAIVAFAHREGEYAVAFADALDAALAKDKAADMPKESLGTFS